MDIYKNLTLIIVCYKSSILIKKNLENLKIFKTIIVDNSNCEETYNLVKNFDNIKYIKTTKNLGYGQANNLGISYADSKFILILNPDILINEESILTLYNKKNAYDNIGILVPSLYSVTNERKTNGSKSFLKKKFHTKLFTNKNFAEDDTCYDFAVGCAFLIDRDFFNKIGGFDKDFFMYFEDNEICDKVYKFHKTVIEIPSSKMIHMEGSSSEKNFLSDCKLSLIHKISEFIYLDKNLSKLDKYKNLIIQLFDYFQRMIFNFVSLKFNKSFKNFLRILSIALYITSLYKLI